MAGLKIRIAEFRLQTRLRWNRHRYPRRTEATEYKLGGGWGNHVSRTHPEHPFWGSPLSVYGHSGQRPNIGDVLLIPMESGRTVRGVFSHVDYCHDPKDMFFGKVMLTHSG